MPAFKKTNAMRMLDKAGVDYEYKEYEYDENDLDGHHVAEYLGVPYEEVFTLSKTARSRLRKSGKAASLSSPLSRSPGSQESCHQIGRAHV